MDAIAVVRPGGERVTQYLEARRATFGGSYRADLAPGRAVRAVPPMADGPLENPHELEGGLALVARGGVNFVQKARAVQAAGAVGLIVLNTEEENFVPTAPEGDEAADIAIPVVCVSAVHAELLLAIADEAAADIAAVNQAFARALDDENRDAIDDEDDAGGIAAQIAALAQGFQSGSKAALGLLFSAANLRQAIEAGDESGAREALEGGQHSVSRWSAPPPAQGSFDPLRWSAELPCQRGTYTSCDSPPLFVASYLGHEPIVRLLLASMPSLTAFAMDPTGEQVLALGLSAPDLHPPEAPHYRLSAILEAWSEGQVNGDGWTPLIAACWRGQVATVKLLLSCPNGMNLSERASTAAGGTPMTAACDGGHWPVVDQLLKKGGGLQLGDAGVDGRSAFALACFRGHTELVRQLLMAPGYQDTQPNSHGHRVLLEEHIFGTSHGVTVGGMLLDQIDRDGNSPLALSCRAGHTEVVKLLIWSLYDGGDIQPTRQNNEGGTPIGLAAFHGHLGVVQAMMERLGKDWKDLGVLGDKFGLRPVQLAAQNEHWAVVHWLEEHGCAWPPEDAEEAATNGMRPDKSGC